MNLFPKNIPSLPGDAKITLCKRYIPLFLLPVGLFFWSSALKGQFVYDDRGYIVENIWIRSLENFLDLSGTRYIGFLSFALNYRIGGLTPFDYHLVNVIIHILNAILIFHLIILTFKTPSIRGMTGDDTEIESISVAMALVASSIFLVHPLHTQAVTYITQRFTSLATFFYLLTVVLYVKARLLWLEGSRKGRMRPSIVYILSLLSAVFAQKTKEISFTIPFIIVLYDYIFLPHDRRGRNLRIPFYLTLPIIPLTLLAPEIGLDEDRIGEGLRIKQMEEAFSLSRYVYILTQFRVIITYMRLLIFPSGLRIDYDYPLSTSILEPRTLLSFIFLIILLGLAIYLFKRSRGMNNPLGIISSFGLFWFFITLSVESFLVPIQDVIFEHRAYLPSVGFIMTFSGLAFHILNILRDRYKKRLSTVVYTCIILLVFIPPLSIALHKRNEVWSDEIRLLNDTFKKSPHKDRLYYARALAYLDMERYQEAMEDLEKAFAMNIKKEKLYNLYGIAQAGMGRYVESIESFSMAIKIAPDHADPYVNRAISLVAIGQYRKALDDFIKWVEIQPGYRTILKSPAFKKVREDMERFCLENYTKGCDMFMDGQE